MWNTCNVLCFHHFSFYIEELVQKGTNIQLSEGVVTVSTPPGVPSVGFSAVVSPCLPSIPRQQHGVTHPSLAGYCQHVEVLLPCNVLVCWVYWLRSSHQADMCHSPPPLHPLLWLGVPNSPCMIISISLAAVQQTLCGMAAGMKHKSNFCV